MSFNYQGDIRKFFQIPLISEHISRRVRCVSYDLMRQSNTVHFEIDFGDKDPKNSFTENLLEITYEAVRMHFLAQVQQHFYSKGEGPKKVVVTQTVQFIDPKEFDGQGRPRIRSTEEADSQEITFSYDEGDYDDGIIFAPKDLRFIAPSQIDASHRIQPRPRPDEAV